MLLHGWVPPWMVIVPAALVMLSLPTLIVCCGKFSWRQKGITIAWMVLTSACAWMLAFLVQRQWMLAVVFFAPMVTAVLHSMRLNRTPARRVSGLPAPRRARPAEPDRTAPRS